MSVESYLNLGSTPFDTSILTGEKKVKFTTNERFLYLLIEGVITEEELRAFCSIPFHEGFSEKEKVLVRKVMSIYFNCPADQIKEKNIKGNYWDTKQYISLSGLLSPVNWSTEFYYIKSV